MGISRRRNDRTGTKQARRRVSVRLTALAAGIMAVALPAGVAQAATWEIGDVFANTPDGPTAVKVFDNAGNFKEEFGSPSLTGEGTGCAHDANHDLYATFFQMNETHKFSSADPHPDIQTIPNPGTNESVVFDAAGNFYVGMADPDVDEFVRKYDAAGNLLDSYTNLETDRGADWIDLAADQQNCSTTVRAAIFGATTSPPTLSSRTSRRCPDPATRSGSGSSRPGTAAAALWSPTASTSSG